jgi:hypothetical protein
MSRRAEADCPLCHGTGEWRDAFGWVYCPCLRLNDEETAIADRIAAIEAKGRNCSVCRGRGFIIAGGRHLTCSCSKLTKEEKQLKAFLRDISNRRQPQQQQLF